MPKKDKFYRVTISRDKIIAGNVTEYLVKAYHIYHNLQADRENNVFYGDSQDIGIVEIAKMLRDEDRWLKENEEEVDEPVIRGPRPERED